MTVEHIGQRYTFELDGVSVDLIYTTSTEEWGMRTLYFTGPREFNDMLFDRAKALGYNERFSSALRKVKHGTYTSRVIDGTDGLCEIEILAKFGLERYAHPGSRDYLPEGA